MLDNYDQGKIFAIKMLGGKEGLIEYMSKETFCDPSTYDDMIIYSILKSLAIEIGRECKEDNLMFNLFEDFNINHYVIIDESGEPKTKDMYQIMIANLITFVNKLRVYNTNKGVYRMGFTKEAEEEFKEKYLKDTE